MPRPTVESIQTARGLYANLPQVTVHRRRNGGIEVTPTSHALEAFVGFSTLIMMSRMHRQSFGSALGIIGIPDEGMGNGTRTQLDIPIYGPLDVAHQTERRGKVPPEHVVDMAVDGTWTLASYLQLPRAERVRFLRDYEGISIVHDSINDTELDMPHGLIPELYELPQATFVVARHVLQVV